MIVNESSTTKRRIKILYVQEPAGGGSLNALYEMLKKTDPELTELYVICYYENLYTKKLETIPGCEVFYPVKQEDKKEVIRENKYSSKLLKKIFSEFDILKKYFFTDRKEVRTIYDLIKKIQPDIVHHNSGLITNRSSVRAASKAGIPQVLHTRGIWHYKKTSANFLLDNYLKKKINAWIFYTVEVKNYYTDLFKPATDKLFVLNDFVDQSIYKQSLPDENLKRSFGIRDEDFVITSIGRITPWKGQQVLADALSIIHDKIKLFKALFVGSAEKGLGSESYLDQLKKSITNDQLKNKVFFTGNRDDVADIIHISDVVVHSSIKPEPQGLVIIEALLCQKEVIASNAGGAAELIKKYGGHLVEPNNANALAAILQDLWKNKKEGKLNNGDYDHEKLANDFNGDEQMRQIMAIYYSICK